MSINVESERYEKKVIKQLKKNNLNGNIEESSTYNPSLPDADIIIDGENYNVEIKQNSLAQMGGTSIKYNPDAPCREGKFQLVKNSIDYSSFLILSSMLEDKEQYLKDMLDFIREYKRNEPGFDKWYQEDVVPFVKGFPVKTTKCVWNEMSESGLLQPVNCRIETDESFIVGHYNAKDTYYIQVGGMGLFYLGENPAKLPIPELCGNIRLELRAGRAGSVKQNNTPEGVRIVYGALRLQGRLQFEGHSDYTLDSSRSVKKLIKKME